MRLSLVTHTHVHVKHKSNRSKMHVCHSSLKKSYHIKPWNKCNVILFPNTFVSKKSELLKALNFTLPLQFIWDLVVNFRMSWELFHSTSAKRLLQDNFLLFSFPEPYSEMFAWKKKVISTKPHKVIPLINNKYKRMYHFLQSKRYAFSSQ